MTNFPMSGTRDQRYTCLAGKRITKSAEILELLGDLDELNCMLGLAKSFSSSKTLVSRLDLLQGDLFQVSGRIAGAKVEFDFERKTRELEKEIEKRRDPGLRDFVKPGKGKASAFLHLARAVCRRAERRAVGRDFSFHRRGAMTVTPEVRGREGEHHPGGRVETSTISGEVVSLVAYLNRLSGVLFWWAESAEGAKKTKRRRN